MITFKDLKEANKSITTTPIKGKEYAEVNQRIKAFRMVYPTGFIKTELSNLENEVCIFRAEVGYTDDDNQIMKILGTGTAYEKESSSFINKTSYIENCETSAVGRALGMAGFGIDVSICSAEELQNAIHQQETNLKINQTQEQALRDKIHNDNIPNEQVIKILNKYNYKTLKDIDISNYMTIIKELS